MTHATNVVGYTYQADIWCRECIANAFGRTYAPILPTRVTTAEDILKAAAKARKINRDDETTFDSDDFPKIIVASAAYAPYGTPEAHQDCSVEEGCRDRCCRCEKELGDGCWIHN